MAVGGRGVRGARRGSPLRKSTRYVNGFRALQLIHPGYISSKLIIKFLSRWHNGWRFSLIITEQKLICICKVSLWQVYAPAPPRSCAFFDPAFWKIQLRRVLRFCSVTNGHVMRFCVVFGRSIGYATVCFWIFWRGTQGDTSIGLSQRRFGQLPYGNNHTWGIFSTTLNFFRCFDVADYFIPDDLFLQICNKNSSVTA